MKTINEDTAAFFQDGGWSFLRNDSDAEHSDASEDLESEFEMESDDFAESSSDQSSIDSDKYSESDSGSGSDVEESGEDWDELEEKARKYDEKKHGASTSEPKQEPKRKTNGNSARPQKKARH
ncbi:FACT complex subunit spt16 [Basidiobolus ranarum]|uniref:FACT complex subunit n=1 Tax=Basidiobolus ranarum TaxID=34480 RepID=A0ABR2VMR1_9FUNG